MVDDLSDLVRTLRASGGDTTDVEVKSAGGGLPASLTASLSALANLPGGGTIILGLDERAGFRPVRLADPQTLKQGLAAKARSFTPPVRLTITDGIVDGEPVVVARVHECDLSNKPCRVTSTGDAYIRGYDGDFRLSDLEVQGFFSARQPPLFDRKPVDGASADDLDPDLVASYLATVRERDPTGLGRFSDDTELLRRAGVILAGGQPTVAGLLALGRHPQQFFPRYVIQASAEPRPGDPPAVRARNQATITGPIPRMLDAALAWARRSFDTAIITNPDGSVTDQPGYPLIAFREVIANALIHRDLDHWSQAFAVEVRLRHDRLVVTNPGGLYGITVDRLGHDAITSARNAQLIAICQHVRSLDTGGRVIEALATGIPTITSALADQGLPAAQYIDASIRFTVILRSAVARQKTTDLGSTEVRVYEALRDEPRTVADLEVSLALTGPNIRKALRSLRGHGYVRQDGGKGRTTTYRRVDG
ncbi:ATP-binding protein [Rugosimonospora africana]|uniref:Dihydroorotate dehydrogenase n=1 Tax=Rugosimonospora africana TaxID=556532 RepID=A0A8J3QV91_9ACTN|nr:ATP-binding protein [Rugosimonospora africana]GIH17463.1 dihydroorotate dehydrogenase [Rugosimonospora africana]